MIRDFDLADIDEIVEILKLNKQYDFPEVDGPEVMKRVKLVAPLFFLSAKWTAQSSGLLGEVMTVQER